ncbi:MULTISPECIES: hypothetical protein [Enterobacteriaceae]|uniref:hypothetical protein n=1 Tax=Enterobacteriaceae TaxID=543 RepID=UPI00119D0123|nr:MULTISPECIES: hypothetical protein [Enterobacteriaceae]
MDKKDIAIVKIKYLINELELVLLRRDMKVLSVSSPEQMSQFIKVFKNLLNQLVTGNIPPKNERALGMARIVIDQWPYELKLGGMIIDAEQAYKNI